jgi:protein-S-isoprenylcysteine O-methyltransferase Ste14
MKIRILEYRPPRIAMALLLVAGLIQVLAPIQGLHLFSSPLLAATLGAGGFVVMMWAWWQFQRNKVAICPTEKTDYLITDGIYRYTRNPMYLGMIAMLLGVATFFGTLPYYAVVVAYFAIIDRSFCPYEEDKLSITFGNDYEKYRSRVRRWI